MVSVFVATSGRPRMFQNMLQSLRETTAHHDIEITCAIDDDDEAWDIAIRYKCKTWTEPFRRGALSGWNRALSMTHGDILVPAGDDQIFHPDWLDYALESHNSRVGGYGVVGMNDLAYDGNTQVATMWLFDRAYCKDAMGGIFAPPVYHYYCVDLEWNEKAKMLGRYWWDERAIVEHLHSAHGKRPVDDTDRFKDERWIAQDNETYEKRRDAGFPVIWEPLI